MVSPTNPAVDLYLDLMAKTLTRSLFEDNDEILGAHHHASAVSWKYRLGSPVVSTLRRMDMELVKKRPYSQHDREYGRDWPARAETMVGLRRLQNVRVCIETVIGDGVPGDFIETGVWRGGTTIFMRAVLKAHGVEDRNVWCADSFRGLPMPSPLLYPADANLDLYGYNVLTVDLEAVRQNFARYGLLDDQVRFLVGWFKDTLGKAPIQQLSILRLDGDLYESTIQALEALYPRLSTGGYCIIDDFGNIDACRQAVLHYRETHQITDEILDVDGWCVYWRRSSD